MFVRDARARAGAQVLLVAIESADRGVETFQKSIHRFVRFVRFVVKKKSADDYRPWLSSLSRVR